MLGEYEVALFFRAIGVLGVAVYVGTYALLSRRILDGDSVAFFAGNTVAAALVLTSNFGEFNLASVMAQVFFIVIGFTAMMKRFQEDTARAKTD